jgi:hypothetical protein
MKKFKLEHYPNEKEMYKAKSKYFEERAKIFEDKHDHKQGLLIISSVCFLMMFINIIRMGA